MAARLVPAPVDRSLRAKVTLSVVLPLVVVLGVFTQIEYTRHQRAALRDLSFLAAQTNTVIENSLRHEMLAQNPKGIQDMLDAIARDESFRIVYLLDPSGRVVFAPGQNGVGQTIDNKDPTCQPCHRLPAAERPGSVVVTLGGSTRVFRSMTPLRNQPECQACHPSTQPIIGLLLTDIYMAPLEAPLSSDLRENIWWWLGTILVAVVVVNLVMSRLVLRRLRRVVETLGRFGRGQLDLRLPPESPDEIGLLAAAYNTMAARIQSEDKEIRSLTQDLALQSLQRQELLKQLIQTQEDERRRIARDLHDDLGQDLAGLGMRLEAAEQSWGGDQGQARTKLAEARALIARVSQIVHAMILSLRPPTLDDLGLEAAVRAQAERTLREAGLRVEFFTHGLERRLPPDSETALFRVFQEAMSNIARHAHAHQVRLSLEMRDGHFAGEIVDDGIGFDLDQAYPTGHTLRGMGLLGMRERAEQFGGTLEIQSRPGHGTRILIRLPIGSGQDG
jgi:signal transduction histidine kinase